MGNGSGQNSTTPVSNIDPTPTLSLPLAEGHIYVTQQLTNDAGQVNANGMVNLTVERDVYNRGQINVDSLSISGDKLDNQSASILANQAVITSQAIDNQHGDLTAYQSLDIQSQLIGNESGKIQAAGNATIRATALNNQQGSLASGALINISVTKLDNQHGSIDANTLQLTAQDLDNSQKGAIRTTEASHLRITNKINNQGGQVTSAGYLKIDDYGRNRLTVDNTDGVILAGSDGDIHAKTLFNKGTLAAGHDLSLHLKDSFQVNSDISAGHRLSLNTAGNVENNHKLQGGNSVSLNAQYINNTEDGVIQSGGHTELSAQTHIDNRGLINSNGETILKAGQAINNIGTGKIYGNHIAIGAEKLVNREEAVNGSTQAASIAARQALDIGVRHLQNQEKGLIYSGGALSVGGELDEKNHASGVADTLYNGSARIESLGDMKLAVKQLRNMNEHFSTEEYLAEKSDKIKEYAVEGTSTRYQEKKEGYFDNSQGKKNQRTAGFHFNDGRPTINAEHWHVWDYHTETHKERIKTSEPGEIIVGGNLFASGDDWLNHDSHILIGEALVDEGLSKDLHNLPTAGKGRIETIGTQHVSTWEKRWYKRKRRPRRFEKNWDDYNSTQNITHDFETPAMVYQEHANILSNQHDITQVVASAVQDVTHTNDAATLNKPQNNQESGETNIQTEKANTTQNLNAQAAEEISVSGIKYLDEKTKLPNNSLFTINPNSQDYVIETDPRFANYRRWLGSDYMLGALGLDPAYMHKRLGDGYYEQRMVNEQVAKLTGYRRLDGYTNDEEQFKALMNAGVTAAKELNLTPGIALSAAQIARLTSDMVWLENQTVTLADGSTQSVLVPKVYVVARKGDLNSTGSLISAEQIQLNLENGSLHNSGTIAGRKLVDLGAQNINNLAGGRISGNTIALAAQNRIDNIGGTIDAGQQMQLTARDITLSSSTQTSGDHNNGQTRIDRVAGLYVNADRGGYMTVIADNKLDVNAAVIDNHSVNGKTILAGMNHVNLGTLTEQKHESTRADDRNYRVEQQSSEVGSQVRTKGDLLIYSQGNTDIRQGNINSDTMTIVGKAVNITEGRHSGSVDARIHHSSNMGLSKHTLDFRGSEQYDQAQGSHISGRQVLIRSDQDINVRGSNIISQEQTLLSAGDKINITAAQNTSRTHSTQHEKESGLMGTGNGFMIGTAKEGERNRQTGVSHTISVIGSVDGRTDIQGKGDVLISGVELISPQGGSIIGNNVRIESVVDTIDSESKRYKESSGLFVGAQSNVTDALAQIKHSGERITEAADPRLKALHAAKAAYGIKDLGALAGIVKNTENKQNASGKITIGIGTRRSESEDQAHIDTVRKSTLSTNPNSEFIIRADGGQTPDQGDIYLKGTDITADRLILDAKRDLIGRSQTATTTQEESSKSMSLEAGLYLGGQAGSGGVSGGVGIYGKGSYSKSGSELSNTTHEETTINANKLTIRTGRDADLRGVVGKATRIEGDIGHDLMLTSEQDIDRYRQKSYSGALEGRYAIYGNDSGISGNLNYSDSKSDYKSVQEQTGLYAGKDGFGIRVGNHTQLNGAVIASEASADKNTLSTGTLGYNDLHNEAAYQLRGGSLNFDSSGMTGLAMLSNLLAVPGLATPVSEHSSSTTQAALAAGNIDIRSDQHSGQTSLAGLSRDPVNANRPLERIFDLKKAQERQELSQLIGEVGFRVAGDLSSKMGWAEDSPQRIVLHALIGGLKAQAVGGNIAAGAAAAGGSVWLNTQVENYLLEHTELSDAQRKAIQQWTALAAGAAIGGATGGNSMAALAGGATARDAEVFNRQLHDREIAKIKYRLAKKFAEQEGISEQEAEDRLMTQAMKAVDRIYRNKHASYDENAEMFLRKNADSFIVNGERFLDFAPMGYFDDPTKFADSKGFEAERARLNAQPVQSQFDRTVSIYLQTGATAGSGIGKGLYNHTLENTVHTLTPGMPILNILGVDNYIIDKLSWRYDNEVEREVGEWASDKLSRAEIMAGGAMSGSGYRNAAKALRKPSSVTGGSSRTAANSASNLKVPVFNPAGADRAARFGGNWQGVSARETITQVVGRNPVVTYTESGKTIYTNSTTGMQVVYDNAGRYFRVENTNATGSLRFTDQFGKPIPNNIPLIQPSKTTQTGVPSDVRNALTHFKDID